MPKRAMKFSQRIEAFFPPTSTFCYSHSMDYLF